MSVEFLLVSCCMEETRFSVLKDVIKNLPMKDERFISKLTVIDNASTFTDSVDLLKLHFDNVYQTNINTGYWSAIDWWLTHISNRDVKYTYIIESDMIHYDFDRIWNCIEFLDQNECVGSVAVQEFSIEKKHLFDKNNISKDSILRSVRRHFNVFENKKVTFEKSNFELDDIWITNLIAKLPSVNRYNVMKKVFHALGRMSRFSETDFQKLYYEHHRKTAVLNGGIYYAEGDLPNDNKVAGSSTNSQKLKSIGYLPTRQATILTQEMYNIRRA